MMIVRAIFTHARSRDWIEHDPTASVERQPVRYSGDYDFYSREEIDALARAAASDQDAAIYLAAAMTGLRRGELVALRWRDVDFPGQAIRVRANYSYGELVTPKSGKVRSVPMVPDVAQALARLGQRELFTGDEDPVFAGVVGRHLDASALRRRYMAAAEAGRPAAAAVPLAAPLLRLDGRQPGVAGPGPVVDGPLAHPDDGALPARQEPGRRRRACWRRRSRPNLRGTKGSARPASDPGA